MDSKSVAEPIVTPMMGLGFVVDDSDVAACVPCTDSAVAPSPIVAVLFMLARENE